MTRNVVLEIDRKVTKRKVTVGCTESGFENDEDYRLLDCCGHPCWPMFCVSCWLPWWGCKLGLLDSVHSCNEPYPGPFCEFEKDVGGRPRDVGCFIDPVSWRWLPASGLIFGALCCVVAPPVYASSLCCPNNCALIYVPNENGRSPECGGCMCCAEYGACPCSVSLAGICGAPTPTLDA